MIVLGFDTATFATAVALRLADGTTLQARDDPHEGEHPGHATRLLPLAQELLERAGERWAVLDRIAVGIGPGRFTGLRVGVATARGLAHSLHADLVGVSSLRALALRAGRAYPDQPLLAVIDARRGEAFAAAFRAGARDARPEIEFGPPLRAGDLADAVDRTAALGGADGCIAVGDGALRFRAQLELNGATVPADEDAAHLIGADAICELGAVAPAGDLREVVPDYRREADAAVARRPHAPAGRI
jgi:tRNA threonylcarbamoyladenosine biosynthesis protein TsaB